MERYLLAIAAFASECVDEHLSGGTASKGTERNDGTERMLAKASLPLKHERTRISALPVGKCFISSGVDRWRWEIADYRFELRPLGCLAGRNRGSRCLERCSGGGLASFLKETPSSTAFSPMNISSTNSQRPDLSQIMQNFFSKVDTDGSGGISESEWQSAAKNRPAHSGGSRASSGSDASGAADSSTSSSSSAADTFAQIDTDGNGEISQSELAAYAKTHHPDGPPPGGRGGPDGSGDSNSSNSTGSTSFDGSTTKLMEKLLKALESKGSTSSTSSSQQSSSTGSTSSTGASGSSSDSSTSSSSSLATSSTDAMQQLIQELIAKLQQQNQAYSANGTTTSASASAVSLFKTSA